MSDDPKLWLSTPTVSHYSENWWFSQFTTTFGQSIKQTPPILMTLEQFALSRWMWVTTGATSLSKLMLDNSPVRTKFGAALSLSDSEILDLLKYQNERDDIGIFLKPDEAGYKRRQIANVPLGAYIVASYVRYLIESFVGDNPDFMQLDTSVQDTLDCIALIRNRRLAMPLDESAYDYHVSRESWLGFISFLQYAFPGNTGVDFFAKYFHSASWFSRVNGEKGLWLSGMPSGLALTSFLNSWMNYIKQNEITPGDLAWAAGDDVLTFPYEPKPLTVIEKEYEDFGSAVNSMKNWTSTKYAEYLKVLYYGEGTTGYPARIWGTLMWAGQTRTFLPSDRLPELAELFKQFFDRVGLRMSRPDIMNYVAADLSRSVSQKVSGFSTSVALEWLRAARVNGGFGMLPYNDVEFVWKTEIMEKQEYRNAILRIPPVFKFSTKVELDKRRSKFTERDFSLGDALHLKPIETMADWEARLNREDIPIKGQWADMALDVIPLPTVDLISTKNMASYAGANGYNVFPNLRGRTDKIRDRLISASLSLAVEISNWMRTHYLVTYC